MARRKTAHKAEYKSFPNCFDRSSKSPKGRWKTYFQDENPITLELGCGKADFSLGLARKYADRNLIGIDVKSSRMWVAAQQAITENLSNMAFLHIHLLEIQDYFDENEVDEIWITFPDPFPKKRQAKHRMINPSFLRMYQHILKKGGQIHFKTDNRDLFLYSLEVFVKMGNIRFHKLSFNLHEDQAQPEDPKIKTAYERQFIDLGVDINYLCFEFLD